MLVFRQHEVNKIIDGSKTAARRFGSNRWVKGRIYKAGIRYSKNGFFALLVVTKDPHQQALKDMTPEDADAEGGYTIHDMCMNKTVDRIYARVCCRHCKYRETCFQFEWVKTNNIWRPYEMVWVVHFQVSEVVKEQCYPRNWAITGEPNCSMAVLV